MSLYQISWSINLEADSPEEAVHKAANMCFAEHIRAGAPDSATVFAVGLAGTTLHEIIDIAVIDDDSSTAD